MIHKEITKIDKKSPPNVRMMKLIKAIAEQPWAILIPDANYGNGGLWLHDHGSPLSDYAAITIGDHEQPDGTHVYLLKDWQTKMHFFGDLDTTPAKVQEIIENRVQEDRWYSVESRMYDLTTIEEVFEESWRLRGTVWPHYLSYHVISWLVSEVKRLKSVNDALTFD